MEFKDIKELIEWVDRSDLTFFELEQDGVRVCLKKEVQSIAALPAPVAAAMPPFPAYLPPAGDPAASQAISIQPRKEDENVHVVVSPMVGVFYEAPQPGAPPFVKVGDTIRNGQVLCIIEAMKLMNEVLAEVEGTIVDILAKNEEMVEYGQPLFKVSK